MKTKDKLKDLTAAESAFNVATDARDNARSIYNDAVASLEASNSVYNATWEVRETARSAYDAANYADRCADYITKDD